MYVLRTAALERGSLPSRHVARLAGDDGGGLAIGEEPWHIPRLIFTVDPPRLLRSYGAARLFQSGDS
jgi:hypothetical protein